MAYIDDDGKVLEGVEADLAEHKKACYIDELNRRLWNRSKDKEETE